MSFTKPNYNFMLQEDLEIRKYFFLKKRAWLEELVFPGSRNAFQVAIHLVTYFRTKVTRKPRVLFTTLLIKMQ